MHGGLNGRQCQRIVALCNGQAEFTLLFYSVYVFELQLALVYCILFSICVESLWPRLGSVYTETSSTVIQLAESYFANIFPLTECRLDNEDQAGCHRRAPLD